MMSTPIGNVRGAHDAEDDASVISEEGMGVSPGAHFDDLGVDADGAALNDDGDSLPGRRAVYGGKRSCAVRRDTRPGRRQAYVADEEEDLQGHKQRRGGRRRAREGSDDDYDSGMMGMFSKHRNILAGMLSAQFLQAVVIAFAIIVATFVSPIANMICKRFAFMTKVPHSEVVVSSLISALGITVCRPPRLQR